MMHQTYEFPGMLDNRGVGQGGGQALGEVHPGKFPKTIYETDSGRVDSSMMFGRRTRRNREYIVNIEAETLSDNPLFSGAFKTQRCAVPADGWYGDAKEGEPRPFFSFPDPNDRAGKLFYFAAIYGHGEWCTDHGWERVNCFILITAPACPQIHKTGHTRQPVILDPQHYNDWLARDNDDADSLRAMLGSREYQGLEVR